VFVGIAEDKAGSVKTHRWAGFSDLEEANSHIQTLDAMATLGNHYTATFLRNRRAIWARASSECSQDQRYRQSK
jgi:hypothetical protein